MHMQKEMTSRERVLTAVSHIKPDRTPANFVAVDEIWDKLLVHFNTTSRDEVLDILQIDCRYVMPNYIGEKPHIFEDGSYVGFGGSIYKSVTNSYGTYLDVKKYILDDIETIEDIDRKLALTDPLLYDYSSVTRACERYDGLAIIAGYASCFYHPTQVRNMEDLLIDMALNPELAQHIINRITEWNLIVNENILKAGNGHIDFLQLADDFSSQHQPMMSIDMFNRFYRKSIERYVALAQKYNAQVYFHCCGSAYAFIPSLIALGVKILDPIQTTATNMNPQELKNEFGDSLTFHGAVETQSILPCGTPDEVRHNAKEMVGILGKGGGYILTSCHAIQADVPLENVLALFEMENRL